MATVRPLDVNLFVTLYTQRRPLSEIARATGRTYKSVQAIRTRLGLPSRPRGGRVIRTRSRLEPPMPSLVMLRQRAIEVQGWWSEPEKLKRKANS